MAKEETGPTLTQVTFIGRQVVKYGLLFLLLLMVGRTFLTAFGNWWRATHPEPPPPPTVGFGVLPAIAFPEQSADNPGSYTLETKTGRLPEFPDRAKVFFSPGFSSSLFDDEETKGIASAFGFVFEPEILNKNTYRFRKSKPLDIILDIDIRSKRFDLKSNFLSKPELFVNPSLPDSVTAVEEVRSYLQSANLLEQDIATVSGDILYLKLSETQLEEAESFSDAQFLQVDLRRSPIDDIYEVFTPGGREGTVHAILTSAFGGQDSIVHMRFQHYPIDYFSSETYPLRSVQKAWQNLQAGNGYVAKAGLSEEAVIRQVSLGYFDKYERQDYLQPVYVFEGDGGFIAYVSAIDPEYIQASGE